MNEVNLMPREKAIIYGIESLYDEELLALLLHTGNKEESVIALAKRLLETIEGIQNLTNVDYYQLIKIKGIKKAKAITVLATIEIAKRMLSSQQEKIILSSPIDIYNFMLKDIIFEKQEKVYLICCNTKLEVIKKKLMFIGSSDCSMVSMVEIFKESLVCNSKRIILVHNHPSNNPTPSSQDKMITKQLKTMAKTLEIEVIDHIIMCHGRFYSFASNCIQEV